MSCLASALIKFWYLCSLHARLIVLPDKRHKSLHMQLLG